MDVASFCRLLPKAELHAHLSGSVSVASLQRHCGADAVWDFQRGDRSLEEVFKIFGLVQRATNDPQVLQQITEEVVLEFAEDGVRWLELRTTPRACADTGMTKCMYLERVLQGISDAQRHSSIQVGVLVSVDRSKSLEEARENLTLAKEYFGRGVVGVELSGNPEGWCSGWKTVSFHTLFFTHQLTGMHVQEPPNTTCS